VAAEDLAVFEDGVEQTIEAFEEASGPISILLNLDASGSMIKATPAVIEAARGFVKSLRPEDPLGVMIFSDEPQLVHDISTERLSVLQTIARYRTTRGTALYDALCDSLTRLTRQEGRRAVIVLTDGRDEDYSGKNPGSQRKLDDVLRLVRESGAAIFPVGIGLEVDRPVLEQIARVSGGHAFFPVDVLSLPDEYRRILENLRRRFNISYTSTNTARDGAWRNVQIRARSNTVEIRSVGGYFAPRQ
jgi:VWFA-related protein